MKRRSWKHKEGARSENHQSNDIKEGKTKCEEMRTWHVLLQMKEQDQENQGTKDLNVNKATKSTLVVSKKNGVVIK